MATDVNDTSPRSMSLSRRYLSLPQELTGASLPPKVSGQRCGTVTLCVAHILPSAVSSSPLPRESLVRVRWWGEEVPGSLFRPSLLSGDGGAHTVRPYSPHRIIAMKYPVNVLPEQLLEYFHDMGHLTLDVIDRDSRRKFGECRLPLDLQRDNQVMTIEEKLVALRRDNVLCEIKPSEGQEGEVAGYLAVTFDVQWTERDVEVDDDVDIVEKDLAAGVSLSDWTEIVDSEGTGGKFEVESKIIEKEEHGSKKRRREMVENRDFQRIQKLLEKGKALQQSMERAVTAEEDSNAEVAVDEDPALTNVAVDEPMKGALLFESDAHFVGSSRHWDTVLTDDARLANSPKSKPSAENESGSEFILSSISSNSSEVQVNQVGAAVNGRLLSDYPLHQDLQREVQQGIQPRIVLKHSMDKYKSFQFAVMLEGVLNVKRSVLGDKSVQATPARYSSNPIEEDEGGGANLLDGANITLRYTVPSHFSRISPAGDNFERIITRKLRSSRWLDSVPMLWADFSGNIHVFQSDFADDSKRFFLSAYLIIETWLQTAKTAERTLLGLSKVPLKQLAPLFSHDKEDLLSLSEKPLPCVGVEGKFPIEDLFSGHLSGYLRTRVCVGTAEQLLTWAQTIRSVVKLQGVIRGVLFRKKFRRSTVSRAASIPGSSEIHSRLVALAHEENRSDSQSTAPTLTTTRGVADVIGLGNRVDISEKQLEYSSEDLDVYERVPGSRPALRKIRFGIRDSWRSVMQHNGQNSEQQQHHGWSASPLLGCEMQGQLVLTGKTGLPGKVKGVPFALWWDAVNRNLNSCFIHTFRARGAYLNEERADLPSVGPQSQVLFALHVENGFFGTQSRETIMGEARLNLYEAFGKRQQADGPMQNAGVEESWTDVDVPIVWDNGNSEHRKLPSAVPLKITYFTSSMDAASLEGEVSYDRSVDTEHRFDAGASEQQEIELPPLADDEGSLEANATSGPAATLSQHCDEQLESEVKVNAVLAQFGHSLVLESDEEEEQARRSVSSLSPGSGFGNKESHDIESLLETDKQLERSPGLELIHLSEVVKAGTGRDYSVNHNEDRGKTIPQSGSGFDNEVSQDAEYLSESDEQLDQSTEFQLTHLSEVDVADTVLDHSMELEDLSCNNGLVPIETARMSDSDTGEVELPEASSSSPTCASNVQHAEKAVQVDLFQLRLQVEMVNCSVQTSPIADSKDESDDIVSEHSDDGTNVAEKAKRTVDVGCDAMEVVDISSGSHSESEEEAPPSLPELDDVTLNVETKHGSVGVPSETSNTGMTDSDTGDVELLPDAISPDHSLVSDIRYVDEAVQADPFELGLQVEMVDCSVQTSPTADSKEEYDEIVSETSDDGANLGNRAEEQKTTVDVGCDAIEFTDENHVQAEEEDPQSLLTSSSKQEQGGTTVKVKIEVPSPQSIVDLVSNLHSVEQPGGSSESSLQKEADGIMSILNRPGMVHNTLQNEKLDLVYEMLREMRESCLHQPAAKPVSVGGAKRGEGSAGHDLFTVQSNAVVYHNREASDKHYSCPSSPMSRPPSIHHARKISLDGSTTSASGLAPSKIMVNQVKEKRCSCPSSPMTQDPNSLRSRGASQVYSFGSTSGLKPATAFACNPKKTSSEAQLSDRRMANKRPGFDAQKVQRTDTSGSIRRLSSSDMYVFQRRYNSQSEETSDHSSVRSLFAHDSETERIARIMQGSMNYWMKDDSSSSGGDELEEEETDDDCYF
ncbi:hypothetical protein PC129_g19569 [Phytophthora cactorum]|uniref:C2CD3 N-terminal C2 domain-containing protein n=1 Tax=Phytophthora cactorum TaxID=29920 RepID=A0A329S7K6_9STRA|nr:hypothetical protein Pcac1_g26831 [Phytophthora cactorum]KAG2801497.1 hypothetical protein PC112_g20016 [Phytophthora cactorum]KAG2810936.1 hypothetical protein PC111_g15441 [Phytophthora cactorum]KAG2836985.1 hypothetical protein PC113_g19924 [Phytophthora cactorum]KAG2879215.1 hypothetical protein PC114_g22681 [Phytophthora cactorum]